LEQYRADWHRAQYWSWRSGDATALQMMQLLGIIAVLEREEDNRILMVVHDAKKTS
jgi:hypothetical protein